MAGRSERGASAYHAGAAAEESAARAYAAKGYSLAERRWRGQGGEIDLILRGHGLVVFAEVKQSASFDAAAASLGAVQMGRIMTAAAEFLDGEPAGSLTECRFDAVLVDGSGAVQILENAFGHG
jgi:putative endonuclease